MGWPATIFQTEPDPNLLCPICRDVIDDAASLRCGHVFCRSCLNKVGREDGNDSGKNGVEHGRAVSISCPSCRLTTIPGEAYTSVLIISSIVENLQIRCKNRCEQTERERSGGVGVIDGGKLTENDSSVDTCDWVGTLSHYKSHAETCPLEIVACSGCRERRPRARMKMRHCGKSKCSASAAMRMLTGESKAFRPRKGDAKGSRNNLSLDSVRESSRGSGSRGMHGFEERKRKVPTREALEDTGLGYASVKDVTLKPKDKDINEGSEPAKKFTFTERPVKNTRSDFDSANKITPMGKGINIDEANGSEPLNISVKAVLDDKRFHNASNMESNFGNDITAAFVADSVKTLITAEIAKFKDSLAPSFTDQKKSPGDERQDGDRLMCSTQAMFVRRHIINFCRKWMEQKPDALYEFVVYRHRISPGKNRAQQGGAFFWNQLLCGLPGPKRTPWEGGLVPIVLDWTNIDVDSPPLCRFPENFHHANVLPSGAVVLSTLRSDWHPETTIPEILFSLQQLLAHPNHEAPAQSEAHESYLNGTYNRRTSINASMYAPSSFLEMAETIKGSGDASSWCLVDDEVFSRRPKDQQQGLSRPEGPAFVQGPMGSMDTRDRSGDGSWGTAVGCRWKCSCCAWGQTSRDSGREMKYRFGTGGGDGHARAI